MDALSFTHRDDQSTTGDGAPPQRPQPQQRREGDPLLTRRASQRRLDAMRSSVLARSTAARACWALTAIAVVLLLSYVAVRFYARSPDDWVTLSDYTSVRAPFALHIIVG